MQKLSLVLAVPLVALALALAAVAVAPSMLNALAPGSTPSPLETSVPSWKVGDTWTYNISIGSVAERALMPREMIVEAPPNDTMVLGTLKETVVGSVSTEYGPAWNVTQNVSLLRGRSAPGTRPEPMMDSLSMPQVGVTGFVWYLQSSLAPVYAYKSVQMERTWNLTTPTETSVLDHMTLNGTYTLSYEAGTEIWYHPALSVLEFPLTENATYNVTSNETIHTWSSFDVTGPAGSYGWEHHANFTVPLDLSMRTGMFENVTTAAGTFRSLPVAVYHEAYAARLPGSDSGVLVNLSDGCDPIPMPHAFATAWFSDQVGNVVRADIGMGGFGGSRIELSLVSYSYG